MFIGKKSIFNQLASLKEQLNNNDFLTIVYDAKDIDNTFDNVVNYVKKLPKDYYPNSKKIPQKEKEHLIKKKPLCEGLKYFLVNPKINSSQQRVQCSINLNKIDIKKKISEGGVLFGKEYTKSIVSSTRNRKKK